MAASIRTLCIGVIAEENNDVEVIEEFTGKLVRKNYFSVSRFVGHGCGKLKNKCEVWAKNLKERGCDLLVVVHDLDKSQVNTLRKTLQSTVNATNFRHAIVLIPVEEMEAWLLADPNAIQKAFNMRKAPKIPKYPEKITSPKEFLGRLVRQNSRTIYINTVHNKKIASLVDINKLTNCPSFCDFPKFILALFPKVSRLNLLG